MAQRQQVAVQFLAENREEILEAWVEAQKQNARQRPRAVVVGDEELERQSARLLDAIIDAASSGGLEDVGVPEYEPVHELMSEISLRRLRLGGDASAMASWIMSLRNQWVIRLLSSTKPTQAVQAEARAASRMIDALAMAVYEELALRSESTIRQQAEEILEISTPVIKVWEGVVAAPLIGALDSDRTQRFMERLLETIAATNSPVALVDITGVPTIDTQTAQHLIDTVSAVRLLGSRVILTGVRPTIAQTLVHLGINMSNITTRASFAGGLRVAMDMLELEVTSAEEAR